MDSEGPFVNLDHMIGCYPNQSVVEFQEEARPAMYILGKGQSSIVPVDWCANCKRKARNGFEEMLLV